MVESAESIPKAILSQQGGLLPGESMFAMQLRIKIAHASEAKS